MVNLVAISPAATMLPLTVGSVTFTENQLPEGKVWSIAPLGGKIPKGLPKDGKSKSTKAAQTLWIGRDQFLQIGGRKPTKGAVTDQGDAWVSVRIEGVSAIDVLARLCPVNLREMMPGDVARSLINHMMAIIVRTDAGFDVMVFRAFAKTLVQELETAAKHVEARNRLGV